MKNLIIIIGIILLIFNTLIGVILSSYAAFNYLLADASIMLTAGLIYFLTTGKIKDGFKIGLAFLFSITGLVRTICCIVLPRNSENNVLLVVAMGILLFEIACFAAAQVMSEKKRT
jgi:hypothetical protein